MPKPMTQELEQLQSWLKDRQTCFEHHTREFYGFYGEKMLFLDAKHNRAHQKPGELEAAGQLKAVITLNIDGLHQAAGRS